MLSYRLRFDNLDDSQIYEAAKVAFGQPVFIGPDRYSERVYIIRWVDIENREVLDPNNSGVITHSDWHARTPAGELWLSMNIPAHAEILQGGGPCSSA